VDYEGFILKLKSPAVREREVFTGTRADSFYLPSVTPANRPTGEGLTRVNTRTILNPRSIVPDEVRFGIGSAGRDCCVQGSDGQGSGEISEAEIWRGAVLDMLLARSLVLLPVSFLTLSRAIHRHPASDRFGASEGRWSHCNPVPPPNNSISGLLKL
jgi:hypothetical protein